MEHKYSTVALLILGSVIFVSAIITALDSSEVDELCNTNNKILKRVSGAWICSDDLQGNDTTNFTSPIYAPSFYDDNILLQNFNCSRVTNIALTGLGCLNDDVMYVGIAENDLTGGLYVNDTGLYVKPNVTWDYEWRYIKDNIDGITSDGTGKVVCIKSDNTLGTCSSVVGVTGTCTCG